MEDSDYQTHGISLGPGGRITDPELVKELERVPILQPRDLLKLAIYFGESYTLAHVGEALWQEGVKEIVTTRGVAQFIKKNLGIDMIRFQAAYDDDPEDWFDPDPEENPEPPFPFDVEFRFASISGIGLLIEKRILEKGEATLYIDGVSPDPKDLPDPEDSEAHHAYYGVRLGGKHSRTTA